MASELSLCMIVKNEEKNLDDCLDSIIGLVDEINIVDTGSTDKTIEIAKRYTDRIFHFSWIDDFSAARNYSYSKSTKDFIIWLDADDMVSHENFVKLLELKSILDDNTNYVVMKYCTYNVDGSLSKMFPKIRITRRAAGLKWQGAVHEDLISQGEGLVVDINIDHKYKNIELSQTRNMRIMKREIDNGSADCKIYYSYGLSEYSLKNYHEAEKYLNKAIESGCAGTFDSIDAFIALHNIYREWGDFKKAQNILENNSHLISDKSEHFCSLGLFYLECLNEIESACSLFKQALSCSGTFSQKSIAGTMTQDYYYHIPYGLLGKAYVSLKDPENALMYYKKALEYKGNTEIEGLVEKLSQLVEIKKLCS